MNNDSVSTAAIIDVPLPHGAERIALFGSVVRGEAGDESDVDILVKFRQPVELMTIAELRATLASRLGRPVDLITEGALSPYLRWPTLPRIHLPALKQQLAAVLQLEQEPKE